MLFWKKKKLGYERAMDWFKHNRVPGQGIIVQAGQSEVCPKGTDRFILTPIYGCVRSNLQEVGNHA